MRTATRLALLFVLAGAVMLSMTACDQTAPTGSDPATVLSVETPKSEAAAPIAAGGASASQGREFFPLEIGNRWHYDYSLAIQTIEGGIPEPPETYLGTVAAELTEMETLLGVEYMVEARNTVIPGLSLDEWEWTRYRQDRSGLYEADVSTVQPPGTAATAPSSAAQLSAAPPMVVPVPSLLVRHAGESGYLEAWQDLWIRYEGIRNLARGSTSPAKAAPGRPGGVLPDELTRLDYPVHRSATWTVREVPLFTSTVEAMEVLDTPAGKIPAWRVRMDSGLFGPNDEGLLWFGRRGLIRMFVHAEAEMVDPAGNPLGVLILETDQVLDDLDLLGPGRSGSAAPGRGVEGITAN